MENITKKQTETKIQFNPFYPEIERVIQTTASQQEIWSDCLIGGDEANKAYNLSFSLYCKGNLKIELFKEALQTLITRHECLRAVFNPEGNLMSICSEIDIKITEHDLSNQNIDSLKIIDSLIQKENSALFDLINGPLLKIQLITVDEFEYIVTLTVHHIIADGLSVNLMLKELGEIYSSYIENKEIALEKPLLFSDFAENINNFSESNEFKKNETYWKSIYNELVPEITLPYDFQRPKLRTYNGTRLDFTIDDTIIQQLKELGKNSGCSLATTLLACFEVFLCKITNQKNLVVGFPTSGNKFLKMSNLIGNCVNLLPLKSSINTALNFTEYLKTRNLEIQNDYEHRLISYGQILKNLEIPRDASKIPLIPVTLNVNLDNAISFSGLAVELKSIPRQYVTFELQLDIVKVKTGTSFQWSYNTSLFKEDTIIEMMKTFEELINNDILHQSNQPISEIVESNYLPLYESINNTERPYPNASLSELLSLQYEITPNNIAIEYQNLKISYTDLHTNVNQFAHYLQANGVKPGDYIAVSAPRCPELVCVIMGIIQCGAAYLPLDHEYPSQRVEFMLDDCQAKFLITYKNLSSSLPKCANTLFIDDAMESLNNYPKTKIQTYVDPENVLYLLYTSGSTGKPKGAKITNKNMVNLLTHMAHEPGVNETDRIPFISTISFDIASFELFFPLFKGGTLVIPDHDASKDGRLLNEVLENEKITLIVATPTTYQMLMETGWSKKLPLKLLCCGEPMPKKLAKELIDRSNELWNLYGPTEVTIFSSFKHIKTEDTLISVGPPIANMKYYIIDDQGNLLPENTVGEIAIAGDGVGKGYLARPELTAAKYVPNTFSSKKDSIMYLSGDLGKLLPTGEVVCVGRKDHQVKVRGHRIEIGEIENTLMAIKNIKSAIVLAKEDMLIAFVVINDESTLESNLIPLWREQLATQLPNFMIPHVFHIIEKMPKTLNDKIDRKTLLEYQPKLDINPKYTAPRTKEEQFVASIWEESLNIKNIDIFGNFFEMGGHSLKALKIMTEIEKTTKKRIPLSSLFTYSTVEKFAKLIETNKANFPDCLVPIKPNGTKNPLFIIHGAGLNVLNFVDLAKHFDDNQPIYGIQGIKSNGYSEWYTSIEDMASQYIEAIVKVNPSGPYALAGFSFGGVVAFEMTRQLIKQGKKVSLTALLDSYLDSSYYYKNLRQKRIIDYLDLTHRRIDYLKEMLTSWSGFKKRFNGKKEHVLKTQFGKVEKMTEQEALAHEQFTEANSMVNKIKDLYHLKPQNFKIDLFRSKDDDEYKIDPIYMGWSKAVLKNITIHEIGGKHLDIVAPPHDKKLARLLQEILDKNNAST